MKKKILIIVSICLLLFLVGCGKEEAKTTEKVDVVTEEDMQTPVDCRDRKCFEEKLSFCEETVAEFASGEGTYHYEILGSKDEGCEVKSWFVTHSNEGWVGKKMTCMIDNNRVYEEAIGDMSKCSGELYKLMTAEPEPEPKKETVTETVEFEETVEEEGMTVSVSGEAEVTTKSGMQEFKFKFRECLPGDVESKIMDTMVYHYTILGPKDDGCEVESWFVANPNPEWVGKKMVCVYDHSQDFDDAVKDMGKCSGELYDIMMG